MTRLSTLSVPYSPIGVVHQPTVQRYPGGAGNQNDLFVWASASEGGRGPNGYTRAFQLPTIFDAAFAGT